ncbi:MAG: hypothetical protein V1719_01185 [Patescibacteria group bacterium]
MPDDYNWDSFTFNGDPLVSILQGIIDGTAQVADVLATILNVAADLLDLLADIIIILDNPAAALANALIALIDMLFDIFIGQFHMMFVAPSNLNDTFGPATFVKKVVESFDDIYDPKRPQFSDATVAGFLGDFADLHLDLMDQFTGIMAQFPDPPPEPMLIGIEHYPEAMAQFSEVIEEFENPTATQFMDALSDFPDALAEFSDALTQYPDMFNLFLNGMTNFADNLESLTDDTRAQYADFLSQVSNIPGVATCMLVYYWNVADIRLLISAVMGLSIFFEQEVEKFNKFVSLLEEWEPRQNWPADDERIAKRRSGRPPNWMSPTSKGVSRIFSEIEAALKKMAGQFKPEPTAAEFLRLLADALRSIASLMSNTADRLERIAELLDTATFTASRLWMPLTYGGNDLLKNVLELSVPDLINGLELTVDNRYGEAYFSFGVVIVGNFLAYPLLQIMGGIGSGMPTTLTPNTVEIQNGKIVII